MEEMGLRLAARGVATFRYQFPYMEQGGKRLDPKPILLATVRSAIEVAARSTPGLTMFAGGKSMGGRMTSHAAAEDPLPGVQGLVFFGFPLHPAGAPSTDRAEHLSSINDPMLFLQGTRDTLADLTLLTPICKKLGKRAVLHIVDGADHSFHVLKSSGRTNGEVLNELSDEVVRWAREIAESQSRATTSKSG
ncbi:MAG: alpha/beta hydrolase [Bacteroidetes bacterium]|nr:alpha/beta hydrolase [Bacteroidota bacterium]